MTEQELQQIQQEFEAECKPLLQWVAGKMGAMVGRREVVKLAMLNEGLRSLALHAAEQLRELDRRQSTDGYGAGAVPVPGAKRHFFDN